MLFNMTGAFMLLFTLHPLLHFLKASCSSSLSPRPSASSICSAGILEASESCRRGRPETRHASLEGAWQGWDATARKTNPGSSRPFGSGRFFSFSVSLLRSTPLQPLPHFLANGRVLFYNVTCLTDGSPELGDRGSCGVLRGTKTSCSLPLPPARCLCSLTASTSAGTSPGAQIWLRGATDPGRDTNLIGFLHGLLH